MKISRLNAVFFVGLAIGLCLLIQWRPDASTTDQTAVPAAGNVQTLLSAYDRWKQQSVRSGSDRVLVLPLSYAKGLSSGFTMARGLATLNLINGSLSIKVSGLSAAEQYDVWLVDNDSAWRGNADSNVGKRRIHVGRLAHRNDEATLETRLHTEELAGFELDQVIVSRADEDSGLLYGSPSLFQRFYYQELRGLTTIPAPGQSSAAAHSTTAPDWLAPFAFLIPAPAHAASGTQPDLEALIAQGEDIFFNETFDGNGRTCGTCHRAENNFTIDPAFIATLPPDDPLFVAEFNPDLAELENPTLMRQFGLIRTNVDGQESPTEKFVMRSVSHLLGMSMSIQSNAVEPPFEMTGWSGDGAPGGGRLRDFSTGAVIQHATKTLDRQEGVDFRLPTDAELDALEAFMLSLGRQQDLNLQTLRLTDANAERGRVLFITEDSQGGTVRAAKCNICHGNAGALTIAGVNVNFKTGVENMPHPADVPGQVPPRDLQVRPRDGGFGKQLNASTGGFGDGSFNTQSLVEAADTAPYFHHNGATTL